MTIENHTRANEIAKRITHLQDQKKRWNAYNKLHAAKLSYDTEVDPTLVNFDVLKALTLFAIDSEIKKLEDEYKAL